MGEIKKLNWDSIFFEIPVYSAGIKELGDIDGVKDLTKPCLLYIFLNEEDERLRKDLECKGAIFCDTRIIYHKELKGEAVFESEVPVKEYLGESNEDLESLAYQAGMYSRFNKDARLRPYFQPLFKEWMLNSLSKKIADRNFVYEEDGQLRGFASCAIKNGGGWLGLISVDKSSHGNGIGKSLLAAVEQFYIEDKTFDSYIITQEANEKACYFYQSMGYKKFQRVFIYHWWIES